MIFLLDTLFGLMSRQACEYCEIIQLFLQGLFTFMSQYKFNVATQLMPFDLLLCHDISCNVATQLMSSGLLTKARSKEGHDTSTYVAT